MLSVKSLIYLVGFFIVGLLLFFLLYIPQSENDNLNVIANQDLLKLSEDLLLKVKMEESTQEIESMLAAYSIEDLIEGLPNDRAKTAFWVNLYNAFFQILAIREKMEKPDIFTKKKITVAGIELSLDNIEHDILRKYRWKYGLGYLPRLFPGKTFRKLAVDKLDYRIHFALNCGAASCPPIAFYRYDALEEQLKLATTSFLESDAQIDHEKKEVHISKLFLWFRADFGGRKGIREIHKQYLGKNIEGYKIKYSEYNWDTQLHNFTENH